jgi:two-component system, sensor histidine kinase and response regulator
LRFSVRDTGIGIPIDQQQMLLEPFVQADGSMTRQYGGTGLGVAISKQLVELMGGRLWVDSTVGRGSTSHVTARFGVHQGRTEGPESAPSIDVRNLLDAQMPEVDGFFVAACIKQDPTLAGATILMLSSVDLADDSARCRELGIACYLMKPVAQADLWQAIVSALSHTVHDRLPPAAASQPTQPSSHQGLRILLAEDNPVKRLLERRGHTVVTVDNGQKALDALAQHAFDVVLMDVQMPVMNGLEATAAIRASEGERGTHLPIIAMTAHAMHGDRERCLAAGMDGFVVRPMKTAELYAAIDRVLAGEAGMNTPAGGPPTDLATTLGVVDGDKAFVAE